MLAGRESARGVPQEVVELVRDSLAAGMQWSFRGVALLALGGLVSVLFVGGSLLRRRGRVATAGR